MQAPDPDLHPIERGIRILEGLIAAHPPLAAEFAASRSEFFPAGGAGALAGASSLAEAAKRDEAHRGNANRRHLEWFCFERTSEVLGELPVHALLDSLEARADDSGVGEAVASHRDGLLHSITGIFQVGAVEPGSGMWLEDMAGHGAYPIAEPAASYDIQAADIAVGRLHPLGDTRFLLSPAVALFRNPRLGAALAADLERIRRSRRGTLRISQAELERMFFGAGAPTSEPAPADLLELPTIATSTVAEHSQTLRAILTHDGELESGEIDQWLASFAETVRLSPDRAPAGQLVEALMERAAFDTSIDLGALREQLHGLWEAALLERAQADPEATPKTPRATSPSDGSSVLRMFRDASKRAAQSADSPPANADRRATEDSSEKVRKALDEFDAGRASGRDLEELFGSLERELGLEDGEEEDTGLAPDFPGVVHALVEEYLWELGLLDPARAARQRPLLMRLAEQNKRCGVIEELETEHLLRLALEDQLVGQAQAALAMSALEDFARWIEEQHGHPLWTLFQRTHAQLGESVERLSRANQQLKAATPRSLPELDKVAELIEDLSSGQFGIVDPAGKFLPLPQAQAEDLRGLLRPGDYLSYALHGDQLEAQAFFPPELARMSL